MTEIEKNKSCLLQILASIISGVIFFYLLKYVFWWVPNLASVLEYVKDPLQKSTTWQVVGLILIFIVSMLLYKLKKKLIVAFGMLELVGGSWTIWTTFSKNFENTTLYSLALGSGIFLLVKGIENVISQKGKDEVINKNNEV